MSPRAEHLFAVIEPLAIVPAQTLIEEVQHRLAYVRIEELRIERCLAIEHLGAAATIAPRGKSSSGHLVERHRDCEALRVEVPPHRLSKRQEGIEVRSSACENVL